MIIRTAIATDAPALAALATQLGYPSTPDEMSRRLAVLLDRREHAIYVAAHEDAVLGWIHVFTAERLESDLMAELGGLVVDTVHHGRGVGSALLEAAEGWAARHACHILRVRSNVVRAEAHRFYEKRGYDRKKQQAVFEKSVDA